MIQIVDHRKLVIENQPIQQFIVDRLPGHHDRYFGTLDKALQRFNTILIKLSQEPLLAEEHNGEVLNCHKIIHNFYDYSFKLTHTNSWLSRLYYKIRLHMIGIRHIPRIKKLLDSIDN